MIVFSWLWSLLAWPTAFLWLILVWVACFVWSRFVPPHRFQHTWPASAVSWILYLSGSRLRLHYHPAYDPKRLGVYCQNHTSMMDGPVALAAIPVPFCGVENRAHFRLPGYGWLMSLAGGIPVPKKAGGRLLGIMEVASRRVALGCSILAFPEGGRTIDGSVRPFHRGAFFLARHLGAPIVPVAVRGLRRVLPKGAFVLRPAPIVDVYVGPQIETKRLSDEQLVRIAEGVRQMIIAYVERGEMLSHVSPARWQVPEPSPAGLSAHAAAANERAAD
ncbi:MAG: 1-acyl-sn-glycerol-3-phosphate acyltransferase [Proteobacteria bacterium]|nr:1-acyl-sn-glycerol-3-phosphate acyltransferase [Pseudomonadota bacterium]